MKTAKLLIIAPNPPIALSTPKAGLGTSEKPEGAGVGCWELWVHGTPHQPGVTLPVPIPLGSNTGLRLRSRTLRLVWKHGKAVKHFTGSAAQEPHNSWVP